VQWLDSLAKPCSTQIAEVRKRYAYFEDTVRHPIDLKDVPCVGAADAPLHVVLYVSLSCPVCKWLYCALSDSLKNGRIRDMALYVKPLSATPLEHILVAIQKEHKQDELLRALAPVKERVSEEMVLRIADSLGISRGAIGKLSRGKPVVDDVASSRAEGLRNGVTGTPGVFINGKRYHCNLNPRWVMDAVRFELARAPFRHAP
jgi:protein-disulfide isomerase